MPVDRSAIEKELQKVSRGGSTNTVGNAGYSPVILFKMMLLQRWYGLRDMGVEDLVNENLSAMQFCGLELEDDVPDHSTLGRFRKELTEKKAMDQLLRKLNDQLEKQKLIVRTGIAEDASMTDSPLRPKGKTTYEEATDSSDDLPQTDKQQEQEQQQAQRIVRPGTDSEGKWVRKAGRSRYGYKRHDTVDQNGMIVGTHTTTANEHDSKGLSLLLSKVKKKHRKPGVFADKGYKVPDNEELLEDGKMKDRIMHKTYGNNPLSEAQKRFNKLISSSRWVVERTFGSIRRWFSAGTARYRGMAKMHTQHVMESMAHNLKRGPGIVLSNCIKNRK